MTTEYYATGATEPAPRPVKKQGYLLRRLTETGEDPVLAKFDLLNDARRFVKKHHPRGREVYVQHPDGHREHYSADLEQQGHSDGWQELTDEETGQ